MKKIIYSAILLLSVSSLFAEGVVRLTLEQCIDSALQNNISVQQQKNQYELQRLQYNQQKQNLSPSVSGYASQQFSFGRATGVDNITVSQNMANTSFGLSANLLLFDGLGMKYRIDEARANMNASEAQTQKLETDLRMNIEAMFLQVLLSKELLAVADTQIEATRLKLEQQEQLVRTGRLAEGELYSLRAQYAREEYQAVQAKNNVQLALLDLAQAINISVPLSDFDIVSEQQDNSATSDPLPSNDYVYAMALLYRPDMRAAEMQLQAAESGLKSAKSAYSPTLTFGASLGTGYYHLYGMQNDPFGKQLSNNFSSGVGFNLNVPIFDRMSTPNSVRRQKIAVENARLNIYQTRQTLRKEIDQAYYNALAAFSQQLSAQKALESAEEAYRYAEQKYEAGRASTYEFYDAKNTYTQALSEVIQASYNYRFKLRVLRYYCGQM